MKLVMGTLKFIGFFLVVLSLLSIKVALEMKNDKDLHERHHQESHDKEIP